MIQLLSWTLIYGGFMLKIGHRGAAGLEPENTLRSFKKAVELGVVMVELDVHLCKTGELVVIHDETLERTTNGHGNVADKTLDELKSLDAGSGEQIPTLTEVLDCVGKEKVFCIELKGLNTAESVENTIISYIARYDWSYGNFLVSSFNKEELVRLRNINKKVCLAFISRTFNQDCLDFLTQINGHSLHLKYRAISESVVREVSRSGFRLFAWTVNQPEEIKLMVELGVDGIFSNFPDRFSILPHWWGIDRSKLT